MANLNDFKLIKRISSRYADLLLAELSIEIEFDAQVDRERIGFYPFVLENICGITEISDICDLITDSDFNSKLHGVKSDDCGIDAVHLDEEKNTINLFNFKYRKNFRPKTNTPSQKEVLTSSKFSNAIETENTSGLDGKIKKYVNEIIEKLNSSEEWKLKLYIVSNEDIESNHIDPHIQRLESIYGLEVEWFGLSQVMEVLPMRPKPISAKLILDNDAIMSFSEDSISSSKSYIIRIPIDEVVRITCNNPSLRDEYDLEKTEKLETVDLEYSLLFDNVRGFITRSQYNDNILNTLKKEPSKFFMYNNGLTVIAQNIEAESINANKKIKITLENFQVINGGQTLRTIHKFHQSDPQNIVDYLSNAQILVRIFKTVSDQDLNNRIAEYTNSQNSILEVDLKSNRKEQIQLEQYLLQHSINYKRKTGDFKLLIDKDIDTANYRQISMERFGQILYSIAGNPHKASSKKKDIFGKYYNDIFGESALEIQKSPHQIEEYFSIKEKYRQIILRVSRE